MSEAWLNFSIVIFVQFLLFVIHTYYEKKLSDVPRILGKSVLGGIVFGLLFDLIFGKFLGLWSYTLGFDALFLILSAALMYGLFMANILLMQRVQLLHFFVWAIVMGVVLEITNYFFLVWTYHFFPVGAVASSIEFFIGLSLDFGTAIFVAVIWHVFIGNHFLFIDNLLKKYPYLSTTRFQQPTTQPAGK